MGQSLGNGNEIAIGTILANSIINTINTNSANSANSANSVNSVNSANSNDSVIDIY